jgi:hypothetical protein
MSKNGHGTLDDCRRNGKVRNAISTAPNALIELQEMHLDLSEREKS